MLETPVYQNLLAKKDATHLVSEVLYGSKLDITFEYECSNNENITDIEGKLMGSIKRKITQAEISGQGNITDHDSYLS